jgi:hypothetical protein
MIMEGRVAAVRLEASMFRERPYLRAGALRSFPAEAFRSLPDGAYAPMDLFAFPAARMAPPPATQAPWNAASRPASAAA